MKEANRARITRAPQDIDTWRASGLKLKACAQSRGEELILPSFSGLHRRRLCGLPVLLLALHRLKPVARNRKIEEFFGQLNAKQLVAVSGFH